MCAKFSLKVMESENYFGSTKCVIDKDLVIHLPEYLNRPQARSRKLIGENTIKNSEEIEFKADINKLKEAKNYINECGKAGFTLTISDNQLEITMKI